MDKNTILLFTHYDNWNDVLTTVYKNTLTGDKWAEKEKNPKVKIYKTKEGVEIPPYFLEYRHKDQLEEIMVSYKEREYEMANMINFTTFKRLTQLEDRSERMNKKLIHLDKRFFGSDLRITDRKIMDFLDDIKEVKEDGTIVYPDSPIIKNIDLGFYDLEWDIHKSELGIKQPIYLATYYNEKNGVLDVFYLIDKDYRYSYDVYENEKSFAEDIKAFIKTAMLDISLPEGKYRQQVIKAITEVIDNVKLNLKGFKNDKDLIKEFYHRMVNVHKPDISYAFNCSADLTQTENRAKHHRIKMSDLFTVPDIGSYVNFKPDFGAITPSQKKDVYECDSYTKFLDYMTCHYSLRGQERFTKWGLEATAQRILGMGKLDYSHLCNSVTRLPYVDFRVAIKYNIVDVLLMPAIEKITMDTMNLLTQRFITRTEYDKVFISKPRIMNCFFHMSERVGDIMSNDINAYLLSLNEKQLEKVKKKDPVTYNIIQGIKNGAKVTGGLCSDPTKIESVGVKVFDFLDNHSIFDTGIDIDATSMYPKNAINGNIAKATYVGKFNTINDKSRVSEEAGLTLIQRDLIRIGSIFFGLPTLLDYEKKFREYKPNKIGFKKSILNGELDDKFKTSQLYTVLKSIMNNKANIKDKEAESDLMDIYEDAKALPSSNNWFYIDINDVNHFSDNGMYIKYNLRGNKLCDVLGIEESIFTDGKRYDMTFYDNKHKPKRVPDLKDPIQTGVISLDTIEIISKNLFITHDIDLDGYTLYINSKMIPCLKFINDDIQYSVYETGYKDIYDIKLDIQVRINKPIEDIMDISCTMRICNFKGDGENG